MRTHVALLRGINVGGHNKVSMADLREIVASIGHREVVTYIQSGNVAFAAADPGAESTAIADALVDAIAGRLPVHPDVVVVSRDQLLQVVADNPFPDETNAKVVHAIFFGRAPDAAAVASAVQRSKALGSPDDARVVGSTVYLWTPDGLGRSKLAAELTRARPAKGAAPAGTARNWATVLALVGLVDR